MQNEIELIRAGNQDLKLLHRLQKEAFMPLYEKYHDDDTSPAMETEERLLKKIEDPNAIFYIIYCEKQPVGGIRISCHRGKTAITEDVRWISPLFIIPQYQNMGIAQCVLKRIFTLYPDTVSLKLATIKQEKRNCHLYEKCGFVRVGEDKIINDKMTLVFYEKCCVVSRSFRREDAEEIKNLVTRNFLEVNSKDYGLKAMQKLAGSYTADKIISTAEHSHMYVFEWQGKIVGVGTISSFWGSKTESILLTIFVLPEYQGKGIGRRIINTLEQDEFFTRARRIEIPASVTVAEFYRKFGYDYKNGIKELDEEHHYRLEKFRDK